MILWWMRPVADIERHEDNSNQQGQRVPLPFNWNVGSSKTRNLSNTGSVEIDGAEVLETKHLDFSCTKNIFRIVKKNSNISTYSSAFGNNK